jgi:hypothetical protein
VNGYGESIIVSVTKDRHKEGKSSPSVLTVFGLNPNYGFVLRRRDITSAWTITQLVPFSNKQFRAEFRKENVFYEDEVEAFTTTLVQLHGELLSEMVNKEHFRVVNCRKVSGAGEELVEVTFDNSHEVKPGSSVIQSGSMLLDPQRFWSLRSYKARTQSIHSRGHMEGEILELRTTGEGFPVPVRAVKESEVVFDADGNKNKQQWTFELDLNVPRRSPSDEEFTLSAFGLPEPAGFGRRPSARYLWLALAGIVCIIVAAYLRWQKWRLMGKP